MGGLVVIAIVVVIVILVSLNRSGTKPGTGTPQKRVQVPPPGSTMSCPNCGSPAMVKSGYWECGYCGDSGLL